VSFGRGQVNWGHGCDVLAVVAAPESIGLAAESTTVGTAVTVTLVERPSRFEEHRFVGDKRTQLVYDLDSWDEPEVVDEFVAMGVGIGFGPDSLAEARNRGYHLAKPGSRRMARAPRS
jgi:hypothetical protein